MALLLTGFLLFLAAFAATILHTKRKTGTLPKLSRMIRNGLLLLTAAWLFVSLVWFGFSRIAYSRYCDGMAENSFSGFLVPRYYSSDENYTYFVKFPDYPSFTGNLAVTAHDESAPVVSFLLWPRLFGQTEYGLIVNDGDVSYQIYTDEDGNALDADYRPLLDKYADDVGRIVSAMKSLAEH